MTPKKPYSFPLTSKDIKRLLRNKSSITLLTLFEIGHKPQFRLVIITKTVTLRSITSRINYNISYSVSPVDLDLKHHHPVFYSNGSGVTKLEWFLCLGYKLYNYQFLI
jgi:hypothetical protein